jgi:hypothetical protein
MKVIRRTRLCQLTKQGGYELTETEPACKGPIDICIRPFVIILYIKLVFSWDYCERKRVRTSGSLTLVPVLGILFLLGCCIQIQYEAFLLHFIIFYIFMFDFYDLELVIL